MNSRHPIVVCVPARNEAERLPRFIEAFAAQTLPATLVIALNNTTDGSLEVIATARTRFPALDIVVDEVTFPPHEAHAGSARRRAMEVGASLARDNGLLITSDADTRPPSHWVRENVAAIERGLDIIGGRIVIDDSDTLPEPIKLRLAATDRYWADVRAIEDAIDPVPWDPPPRHGDHTGASLAMRAAEYTACGGVPCIASGEDRALVQALLACGAKLGHPPQVWTRVSARSSGRAAAGMAEAMAKLAIDVQHDAPTMLPDHQHWHERAVWRKAIRDRFGSAQVAIREAMLPPMPCDHAVTGALQSACA